MRVAIMGAAALLCLLSGAVAAETGVALKTEDIRAEPFVDAKPLAKLSVNDKVEILGKSGSWLQIRSANGKGWVRMLSIRKGDAKKRGNESAGLLNLASGRSGTGKIVATTGIRGLNEEELKAAKFNLEEVILAESYASSKARTQQFASEGKLVSRKFDYLPETK